VKSIIDHLDRDINVVLEFGRYRDITAYVLVANMLARRIYTQYQSRTEKAMAEGALPPHPLVITIEEAHKFLNPEVSSQTIFGTIARDIDSVLAGVSGKNELKSVLSRLAPKQQALIFGHAVPMPVAFQPREYGSAQSYKDLVATGHPKAEKADKDIEKLWE
jgi:DNA helicase HerA-like ATPase